MAIEDNIHCFQGLGHESLLSPRKGHARGCKLEHLSSPGQQNSGKWDFKQKCQVFPHSPLSWCEAQRYLYQWRNHGNNNLPKQLLIHVSSLKSHEVGTIILLLKWDKAQRRQVTCPGSHSCEQSTKPDSGTCPTLPISSFANSSVTDGDCDLQTQQFSPHHLLL